MNLFERAIAFSLKIGSVGIKRKVSSSKMELKKGYGEQPDESRIGVNKEIIDSQEYDAILSLDNKIRLRLMNLALPSPLKKGIYLIPLPLVERVDKMVEEYKKDRDLLVKKFLESYSTSVKASKDFLGGLFDLNDYPSEEAVKEAFYINTNYIEMGLPNQLQTVSPEIFQREKEEFKEKIQSAVEEVRNALRTSFADLVNHMVDRLSTKENGKPKSFHTSMVENFVEFLDTFSLRNITDDAELSELIKKAQGILSGSDPEELRKNSGLKEIVAGGMAEIKSKLDTMIIDKPLRKFNWSE